MNQLGCGSNMLRMAFSNNMDNLRSIPARLNDNAWCDLNVFSGITEPLKDSGYGSSYKGYMPRIIVQNIWKETTVVNKHIKVCSQYAVHDTGSLSWQEKYVVNCHRTGQAIQQLNAIHDAWLKWETGRDRFIR